MSSLPSTQPTVAVLPKLNGDQYNAMYFSFNHLEGKVLTFVDSLFPEGQQNKAAKDVLREMLHDGYSRLCQNIDPQNQFVAPRNAALGKRRK